MLMEFYCHSDSDVLVAVVAAIDKVIKSLKKEAQVCIVPCLHKTLNKVVAAYKDRIGLRRHEEVTVPAICEAKGIAPLMATYIQGLLNGTPEVVFCILLPTLLYCCINVTLYRYACSVAWEWNTSCPLQPLTL